MNSRIAKTFAAIASLLASAPAWAETWWEGDSPDASNGNTYWEDSGNWYNGFSTPAHFVRRNFTEGRSRTVSFRSANEFAGYLVFGNDNASETQCDAGAVVFQADSATAGFKITNTETIYIGAGDGEGSIKVESGTYNAYKWVVGQGKTASVEVTGGTVTSRDSAYVGQNNGSAGTLTVSDGGVFVCGEGTGETQLQLSQNTGSTGTININEGGTLVTAHIQPGTGTPIVNFNGGTLKLNYGGTVFGSRDNFTNYVNAAGGTLDTAGYTTYVKALIKGEGTLKITGGGTVRFDNSGVKPECPIYVEEGVVFLTSAMTPANIRIGKNGFIRYDLVGITDTSAEDQTLAEGVTITLDDGETLAEHVLICNNGSLKWQAYLDGTTLKAKNMTSETATTTIWTFRSGNKWFGNAQNWTCGVPSPTVKTIIPFATTITQGDDNFQCGDVILKTEGTLKIETDYYNKGQNKNFRATSISGDGVVDISVHYLEPNPGAPCNVNVPLTISNQQYGNNIKGHDATAVFNINDSLTLPVNQTCTVENFVNINGDLVVDGTITFNNSQTLKGAIAGGGTIAGSFTTAEGATLYATVTNANATAECLTVTGNADLSNADVEILGGELLAEAADVTEIILLKASGTITWSKKSYVIPGQDKAWTIKTDTWTDEDTSTTYNILKAVKSKPGFVIIVQ
ncbi:MAG: hypothetical protein II840_04740 [Kiritimatiellae bacterium]|nr:hypothetical protein [Kiritimatiellia bacterium]